VDETSQRSIKGIVFVEFIEMVDNQFSLEMSERLIEMTDLPSKGVYTSVGTYDFNEMLTLFGVPGFRGQS
jgi:hypothetical protein